MTYTKTSTMFLLRGTLSNWHKRDWLRSVVLLAVRDWARLCVTTQLIISFGIMVCLIWYCGARIHQESSLVKLSQRMTNWATFRFLGSTSLQRIWFMLKLAILIENKVKYSLTWRVLKWRSQFKFSPRKKIESSILWLFRLKFF